MEVGIILGIFVTLFFAGGFAVSRFTQRFAERKHIDSLKTCEDHRQEGDRLIHKAVRARNLRYASHLRDAALAHYMRADILENGPYKC